MRCTVQRKPYSVFGYAGKQVRDNIHSADVVAAFTAFHADPRAAAVYNLWGGRESNCSILEATELCEVIADEQLSWQLAPDARPGDHRWWISDTSSFEHAHPEWSIRYDVEALLREIHDENAERWLADVARSR